MQNRLIFSFLLFIHVVFTVTAQQAPNRLPPVKSKLVVIAHRGNHTKVPENTVASVVEAIKAGADYVEIDLRTTKDGYLVIHHDGSVNRMTNGKGNINELTLQQIKALSINGRNGQVFHIPEFKEILSACKGRIHIYLDFKDADVKEAYRQICLAGMQKQIVVYLNREMQYSQWREAAPAMPLMTSLPETVRNETEFMRFLQQTPVEVLDNAYDTAMTALARKNNVSVWLDVEGDGENATIWKEALSKNIQGLQTDHPEALIAFLKQTGRRNGKPRR